MPNVTFVRPELKRLLPEYYLIRDCISGESAIKEAKDKYLPRLNPSDTSKENITRYDNYIKRAVFYNVTRRTLNGLVGQVFAKDPIIEIPALLENVKLNASGNGVNLIQQSKRSLSCTLAYSRSGLFVDYPDVAAPATMAEVEKGKIRPTIITYAPHDIINWRVTESGANEVLSLVVLSESYEYEDDGFELKKAAQFRVLKLEGGTYVQEIWKQEIPTPWTGRDTPKGNYKLKQTFIPKDSSGNPFTEIPFMFIGSNDNDTEPDNPNFYDIASLNIAHYRNSADYEENVHIQGQTTAVAIGLTEEWLKGPLDGKIRIGATGGVPLPEGGDLKLVQATEKSALKEAMDTKERQMVALGAKLVEQKQVQRTAFETKIESTSESSILASTAANVQAGYLWALNWCCKFVGITSAQLKFELNTNFDLGITTPEERTQIVNEWKSGAISFKEMRGLLRKAGIASEEDETALADIMNEKKANAEIQASANAKSALPTA